MSEIIGHSHHIIKLSSWLLGNIKSENVAIIAGPHGIGKNIVVKYVLEKNGIEAIDPNIKEEQHVSFAQFIQKQRKKVTVVHEYDDDKIQKYAQTLNNPIIFICTNLSTHKSWKMKGGKNGNLILYFNTPSEDEIANFIIKKYPKLKKETPDHIRGFIQFYKGDVRAILNHIIFWDGLGPSKNNNEEEKLRDHKFATPFDVVPTFFRGKCQLETHYENMWNDNILLKMLVAENYLNVKTMVFTKDQDKRIQELKEDIIRKGKDKEVTIIHEKRKKIKDGVEKTVLVKKKITKRIPINLDKNKVKELIELERIVKASDILSDANVYDAYIAETQLYELEPYASICGIVGPGQFMNGRFNNLQFPTKKTNTNLSLEYQKWINKPTINKTEIK